MRRTAELEKLRRRCRALARDADAARARSATLLEELACTERLHGTRCSACTLGSSAVPLYSWQLQAHAHKIPVTGTILIPSFA